MNDFNLSKMQGMACSELCDFQYLLTILEVLKGVLYQDY